MSSEQAGQRVRQALTAHFEKQYLNTLDAVSLNAALYLIAELKISPLVIPRLLHLLDQDRCKAVLEFQIDELLKKIEEGSAQSE